MASIINPTSLPFLCRDSNGCMICVGSNPGGCRDTGVTYKIRCFKVTPDESEEKCRFEYIGQTGKNGYTRGKKHIDDYRQKRECSALWKHCIQEHGGEMQKFEMKIEDKCRNDPTKRQILEAIRIQKLPRELIINGRSEWNSAKIPRMQISTDDS